eukprot:TRINITY_DN29294_c0_g2_i1.p1 TRINITY_DN29294_c0_g2~~TRINITY_DN29294_c0_g2_i1.p1  ORF type:complete len:364 (+),score=40.27 TRINITY_DN29294_c0_g2_i1:74-1165(+)
MGWSPLALQRRQPCFSWQLFLCVLLVVDNMRLLYIPGPMTSSVMDPRKHHLGRRGILATSLIAAPAGALQLDPNAEEIAQLNRAFAAELGDPARSGVVTELKEAESIFGPLIARWEGPLERPAGECVSLRVGRAHVRTMLNNIADGGRPGGPRLPDKVAGALEDLDVAIGLMDRGAPGDFPKVLLRRALAREQLQRWEEAIADYSRAIEALPANNDPLVLSELVTFRGDALSHLGRYGEALEEYEAATQILTRKRLFRQMLLSRTNEALALFGDGNRQAAIQIFQTVLRQDPYITDAHAALAALYWTDGKIAAAEETWSFACERIDTGCKQYTDLEWVAGVRRWPPGLIMELRNFLTRKSPGR